MVGFENEICKTYAPGSITYHLGAKTYGMTTVCGRVVVGFENEIYKTYAPGSITYHLGANSKTYAVHVYVLVFPW